MGKGRPRRGKVLVKQPVSDYLVMRLEGIRQDRMEIAARLVINGANAVEVAKQMGFNRTDVSYAAIRIREAEEKGK